MSDDKEVMDTVVNPENVRQSRKDFSSTLWTHINTTRRVIAECFINGMSRTDIMIADSHVKVLNSLIIGMADELYERDLSEFKLKTDKYKYRSWNNDRDMFDHHNHLIDHLENVIRLLGRKGEFPEEDIEMYAE